MSKQRKPLTREGEPTQTTKKGLEIPVPTEREVSEFFDRVLVKRKTPEPKPEPSESERP